MSGARFLALSELAAGHVTVALCGQGADELLAGYRKHQAAVVMGACDRLPRRLRSRARLPAGAPARLQRAGRAPRRPERGRPAPGDEHEPRRPPPSRARRGSLDRGGRRSARRATHRTARPTPSSPLSAALVLDARLALVDDLLLYFDRLSMAHSLEVRVPFLDHRVVECCAQIPELKMRRLRRSTSFGWPRAVSCRTGSCRSGRSVSSSAVDGWVRSNLRGAVSDYLLDPGRRATPSSSTARGGPHGDRIPGARPDGPPGTGAHHPDAGGLALLVPATRARGVCSTARAHRPRRMTDETMLSYAVVTPVRNEAANIQRLGGCLRPRQSVRRPGLSSTRIPKTRLDH